MSSPSQKNISVFQKIKSGYINSHPVPSEGTFRERHGRQGGDAVDAAARETGVAEADGEIVWSRHPNGWCQVRNLQGARATVAKAQGSPRRARISRTPLRGECRVIPV